MVMIEITESKLDKLTECTEKMLKYGGKIMQVLEELEGGDLEERSERGNYGQRGYSSGSGGGSYGNRGGGSYGSRSMYGNRMDEDDEDEEMGMGERRRRRR